VFFLVLTVATASGGSTDQNIRERITKGMEARAKGEWTTADTLLSEAVHQAELSTDAAVQAEAFHELAYLRHDQGRCRDAVHLYEKALVKVGQSRGEKSREYAACLQNMGQALSEEGKYQKSRKAIEKAIDIIRSVDGNNSLTELRFRTALGLVCRRQGRIDEALRHQTAVLTELQGRQNSDPILVVAAMVNLGVVLTDAGEFGKARDFQERALEFLNQLGISDSLQAAACHNALARVKVKQRQAQEARVNADKALAICEAKLGKNHPHTVTSLEAVGEVDLLDGKAAAAAEKYKRVLEVRTTKYGEKHPLVAEVLSRLGNAQRQLKQTEEAGASYRRAHEILLNSYGGKLPTHYKWVADDYAAFLRWAGKAEEAKKVEESVHVDRIDS
jgi:tetratricopeptide (TPR) repeat protein